MAFNNNQAAGSQTNQVKCSLCPQLMTTATATSCGHHFCRSCLYYVLPSNTCPLCGSMLFQQQTAPVSQAFAPPIFQPQNTFPPAPTLPQYMLPGASWGNMSIAPALPPAAIYGPPTTLRGQRPAQQFQAQPIFAPPQGSFTLTPGANEVPRQVNANAQVDPDGRGVEKGDMDKQQQQQQAELVDATEANRPASKPSSATKGRKRKPKQQGVEKESGSGPK